MPPADPTLRGLAIGLVPERASDRDFVRHLHGVNRAHELLATGWRPAAITAFLDDQFRLQSAHFAALPGDRLIVTQGDASIGRLYIDRTDAPWRLLEIGLLPSAQRAGLGGTILGWLKREAGAAGIELQVAIDNSRAAAFYRRHGFVTLAGDSATHDRMRWQPS